MLFDAHADILTDMYQESIKGEHPSFRKRHLDNYRKAGITHSIFVNWTDPSTTDSSLFEKIFNHAFEELHEFRDIFHIIKTSSDFEYSTEIGKIGVLIGMEGICQLKDVNQLRDLYQKGVRHAGLTWNEVNRYAGGLSSETDGLTLLGEAIVSEMEKLGMVIDLAHANPKTFRDVFDHTTKPLIISHGNVKAVCNHIRNYTDEQLQLIKSRGGVIGICGIKSFIGETVDNQTVAHLVDHIEYVIDLLGIDYVGLGLDVCYYLGDINGSNGVENLETIADAPNILTELKRRGYHESQIQQIAYGNFARVIKQILG